MTMACLILLISISSFVVDAAITLSSGYSHILVNCFTSNPNLVYEISLENEFNSEHPFITYCKTHAKIDSLPPATEFNVTITTKYRRNTNVSFKSLQTISTKRLPHLGLRYDICSKNMQLRWNIPASMSQDEAKSLVMFFQIGHKFHKIPVDSLKTNINGRLLNTMLSLQVKVAPAYFGIFWPPNGLTIAQIPQVSTVPCDCLKDIFISTSLTSIQLEWSPRRFSGSLEIVLEYDFYDPLISGKSYILYNNNTGREFVNNLPLETVFKLTVIGKSRQSSKISTIYNQSRVVRTLGINMESLQFRCFGYLGGIVCDWNPPISALDEDFREISVILKVKTNNHILFFKESLTVGLAVLRYLKPNSTYSVAIALGSPECANEQRWSSLRHSVNCVISTNATEDAAAIHISTTLTSIHIHWDRTVFDGDFHLFVITETTSERWIIDPTVGSKQVSALIPDTEFKVMIRGKLINGTILYSTTSRTKNLDTYNAAISLRSIAHSNSIMFIWDSPSQIPEEDASALFLYFKVDNFAYYFWHPIRQGFAEIKKVQSSSSYHVEVRLGPPLESRSIRWPIMLYHATYLITTNKRVPKLDDDISIKTTLTSITITWSPEMYLGKLNFLLQTDLTERKSNVDQVHGYAVISSLPPNTLFNITISGQMESNNASPVQFTYFRVVATLPLDTYGVIRIRGVGESDNIRFFWDPPSNIPEKDASALCIIFKVATDNYQTGFYRQYFELGYAELSQLQPNHIYDVDVRLGPDVYSTASLWPILRRHSSHAIKTRENGEKRVFLGGVYQMKWKSGHRMSNHT